MKEIALLLEGIMPKYKAGTEKLRAKQLVKSCLEAGLNQSKLARQRGVSQQAINQAFQRPIVKKTFAELMDKAGMSDTYLRKKLKEGLEANKVLGYLNSKVGGVEKVSDEFIETPDFSVRHKFLVTALEVKGHIKINHNEKGVNVSTIVFNIGNKAGLLSKTETDLVSHQ